MKQRTHRDGPRNVENEGILLEMLFVPGEIDTEHNDRAKCYLR